MTITNYCPDSTKIIVAGVQIDGLANKFLTMASHHGFTLRLHGGSQSLSYLMELLGNKSHVKVDVSMWIDISNKAEHIDLFDIKGEYLLVGWTYDLNTTFPEIEFKFVHNSPLYT